MLKEIELVEVEQSEITVASQGSISDYERPDLDGATSSIVWPPIVDNNFELKPNFIQMV